MTMNESQSKQFFDLLKKIDDRVERIDLSITGDPARGTIGMKQHVESLQKDFHDHTTSDAVEFAKMEKMKSWAAGALFVATSFVSLVVVVANIYFKTK